MKKSLSVFLIILAVFSISCSKIKDTPSAIVLQYYKALHKADINSLQETLTKESYYTFIEAYLMKISDESKISQYDNKNFKTDHESLKRVGKKVAQYLKEEKNKNELHLISETGISETLRSIKFNLNGINMDAILTINEQGKWKIKKMPF